MESLSTLAYKIVHYPIKRYGAKFVNVEDTMSASLLWCIQQAVAETKFEVLKHILESGCVPTNSARVEIEVRVVQNAVDSEATGGKWIQLDEKEFWLCAYKLDGNDLTVR